MIDNVFRDNAQFYWDAGIPVMPLKVRSKAPILNEWGSYGKIAPTKAMQGHWLETYPHSNIGLPFGPASGLCAIDIDTVDQKLVEVIMDELPPSPWVRIGKKGCGLIYRWAGQKNFKIRSQSDGMIMEMLGQGNQLVMPPSIHPDTLEPYTSNVDLWEVMDQIQLLPIDIEERLRAVLGIHGGVSLSHEGRSAPLRVVPQGERDIEMVRRAGYYARVVLGIDKSAQFTLADAITHMDAWVRDYTSRVSGDDMAPDKGIAKLLEFLIKDVEAGKSMPEGWDVGLNAEQLEHPTVKALVAGNEIVRWTYTKARDWINEQVLLKPEDSDWAIARVMELVGKVAKDDNFKELDFNGLVGDLKRALGAVDISKPELKKAFRDARAGTDELAMDHEALATEIIAEMERGGELRYSQGTFWQWQGSCFSELTEPEVLKTVAQCVKGNTLSRRYNDYVSILKTIRVLVRDQLVESMETGVNFANGFLDAGGVLHEHSPKFGKTFTMPFNYIPERATEAHKWFEYLEGVWGDCPDYEEKIRALQEAFAATMFGVGPQYQRAILLFGHAGTGKSQVLEVLRSLMPPAAVCSIPPQMWAERFVMSDMVGKTLNICGELPESGNIVGNVFKQVIAGEQLWTERKQQAGFNFNPTAANWFASNFLPRSKDSSEGFFRRWLVLEFTKIVPEKDRIPNYADILVAEEREAIAAWAVQGLSRLIANPGYTLPASHVTKLGQVKRSNNSVLAFLGSTSKVIVTNNVADKIDLMACFDQYVWYTREIARGYPVGFERFSQMLEELRHSVTEYYDTVAGHNRSQASGLKMGEIGIQDKWKRAV